jgi:hypothetical protein
MREPLLRPAYRDHIKDLAVIPALAQSIAGDLAKRSILGFTKVAWHQLGVEKGRAGFCIPNHWLEKF